MNKLQDISVCLYGNIFGAAPNAAVSKKDDRLKTPTRVLNPKEPQLLKLTKD